MLSGGDRQLRSKLHTAILNEGDKRRWLQNGTGAKRWEDGETTEHLTNGDRRTEVRERDKEAKRWRDPPEDG